LLAHAADTKANAIVDGLRASKMGKAADLVEQGGRRDPDAPGSLDQLFVCVA